MFSVLKRFGFNNSFIKWIETLYNNTCCTIMNNGWRSETFYQQRGVKQGCPISALIFIIIAEVMAKNIRTNENIKGIPINLRTGTEYVKISQLADDTSVFFSSKNEIKEIINTIESFGKVSGLTLNKQKTSGMWLGNLKFYEEVINDISFVKSPIKALGVYFGHDKTECNKLNWQDKIENCKNTIQIWKK